MKLYLSRFPSPLGEHRHRRLLIATAPLLGSLALASEPLPSGLYEITVETNMPHLEENLRYATTHETRCLRQQDLSTAFPVLQHASLKDCRLEPERRADDAASYRLVCDGGHGTTGNATWTLDAHRITGTLHVKLGGKNMTFSQRWTAVPLGQCEAPR
jgi:hypothetical protein